MGFACRIRCSTPLAEPATSARKLRHCFVASVFPAPLSPEMRIEMSAFAPVIARYAALAIANVCGACSRLGDGAENSAIWLGP